MTENIIKKNDEYETKEEYYPNNKIKCSYTLKNKVIDGVYKKWRDSGELYSQHTYENGKIVDGILFNLDGSIRCNESYKNGFKEGEYKFFDESGDLEIQCFYKNGFKEGECKLFYNGALVELSNYKRSRKNGLYQKYFDDGKINISCYYLDNILHGESICYDENGVLLSHCNYINGVKQ